MGYIFEKESNIVVKWEMIQNLTRNSLFPNKSLSIPLAKIYGLVEVWN